MAVPNYIGREASNDLPSRREPQHAAGYGILTPAQGKQFNQYNNQVLAKMFPGVDPSQVTTWLQQHPGPEADKINTQLLQGVGALANPDTGFEKAMQAIALGLSVGSLTAGFGAIAAPAIAGAVGGGAAGSIAAGAATGAVGAVGKGLLTTGGVSGKDVGIGALGGGIASAAAPLASGINNATGIGSTASNALIKAGVGAASSGLRGGSALQGGLAGGLGSLAGAGLGAAGVGGLASGFLGNQIGSYAGRALSGSPTTTGASTGAGFLGAGIAQGINGNMAQAPQSSTDSTLAGTITGALPGILQGAAGIYGSQNAAEKQTQADQNAIGTQQSTLGNINNIWGTQQKLGQGAQTALGSALGTNGQPADYSNFLNMPGYQFAVQQGTQAIQRQAASMGNAYTPNTAAAVGQYVTGTAAQDYNTYIQQLMGAAGLGSTANTGIANPTYQTGANISTLQQNQGQAQASGVSGGANAVGGMLSPGGVGSSLIGAAGKYLFGGGSGGGGGGGGGSGGDPFAGTSLANNSNAFQAYNAANGPTSGDIGNLTWGAGDTSGAFDPNSITTPDTLAFDTSSTNDMFSGDNTTSFLGY